MVIIMKPLFIILIVAIIVFEIIIIKNFRKYSNTKKIIFCIVGILLFVVCIKLVSILYVLVQAPSPWDAWNSDGTPVE